MHFLNRIKTFEATCISLCSCTATVTGVLLLQTVQKEQVKTNRRPLVFNVYIHFYFRKIHIAYVRLVIVGLIYRLCACVIVISIAVSDAILYYNVLITRSSRGKQKMKKIKKNHLSRIMFILIFFLYNNNIIHRRRRADHFVRENDSSAVAAQNVQSTYAPPPIVCRLEFFRCFYFFQLLPFVLFLNIFFFSF